MQAGFAQIEITPPLGTRKIGCLDDIIGDQVADPLYARVAVLESANSRIALVQMDLLSVRWTFTQRIRSIAAEQFGFPGGNVMVAATHNHAGPAVANVGRVKRDEAYVADLVNKIGVAFGQALHNLRKARIGIGTCFEFDVSDNRRAVMRDGTARTHARFDNPDAMYIEGPIDPELTVIGARNEDGEWLGAIVNFACHPTHHCGDNIFSPGYPGVLARQLNQQGYGYALFLNGACGNIHTQDPRDPHNNRTMERAGRTLAKDTARVLDNLELRSNVRLSSDMRNIQLPYRQITEDEIAGTVRGAQRFVNPDIYDEGMPALIERIRTRKTQPVEVQALFVDEYALVGIPAEYFVQLGLRIKQNTYPARTLIVSHANGMVGYLPHNEAFERGGYETTFAASSRMAPEAGEMVADCAIDLVRHRAAQK